MMMVVVGEISTWVPCHFIYSQARPQAEKKNKNVREGTPNIDDKCEEVNYLPT